MSAATFTVANGDVPGLIAAIQAANATLAEDTIELANNGDYVLYAPYFTSLSVPLDRTGLPWITTPITIEGHGSVIRRGESVTFVVPDFRILRVRGRGAALTARNLGVHNGKVSLVNGDNFDASGAGIRNDSCPLTIENCSFEDNQGLHHAGAIHTTGPTMVTDSLFLHNVTSDGMGAIRAFNTTSLTVERCYFFENRGDSALSIRSVDSANVSASSIVKSDSGLNGGTRGVDIYDSVVRLANCTIFQSTKHGVDIRGTSVVTIAHCTIYENGKIPNDASGIYNGAGAVLNLVNTIVANSEPHSDCSNMGIILQNTGNLIRDGSCNPDFIGDPKLGTLGTYGGPTPVLPLLAGSPAIDSANDAFGEPVDQRGVARPKGAHWDIGAYEGTLRVRPDYSAPFFVDILYNPEPYVVICDPLGGETISMAILGSRSVAAKAINFASLSLGNAPAGTARLLGIQDVNRDGIEDLVVQFPLNAVYQRVSSCEAVTLLELQGETFDRLPLTGYINVTAAPRSR